MALIGTLTSGVSALKTFSKGLEVIGNNIANVNTTGFKSSSASYADTFSNTLDSATQIGTGVQLAGVSTNYTQGSISSTGETTDLAISGNGYFVVQNSSGVNYATRDGSFSFDDAGNLVTSEGNYVLSASGAKITVPNYENVSSVSIGTDGTISAFYSDGTATDTSQQIGLLNVTDQNKLTKVGGNLYDFSSTGVTVADLAAAGSGGLGTVQSGSLELSNVDLTEQFSNLITAQRSFQAGSRIITVSDTVLEDVVNLKRS
jgi:flagellar hook protein FlgE